MAFMRRSRQGISSGIAPHRRFPWCTVSLAVLCFLVSEAAWALQAANKSSAQAQFNEGARLQQTGDLQGARRAYQKALELEPDRIDALSNLGLLEFRLGNYSNAIALLERAVEIRPELAQVRQFLGLAYFQVGRFTDAHREVSQIVERNPADARSRHLLGLCLLKLNRLEEGIEALETALEGDPANLQAAYTLATAYVTSGDIAKAEALLEGPLQSGRGAEVHLIRGAIHTARREYPLAIDELKQALQLNPKLPTAHERLGRAYLSVAEYQRAAEEFRAELEGNPLDFHANTSLGFLLLKDKRYDEALERLAVARAQDPSHPAPLFLTGQIHQEHGEAAKAAELLEQVVVQQPDYTPAHVLLARAYAKLKRREDFRREQAIIRRLNEEEQTRNLGREKNLPGLPEFSLDPASDGEGGEVP
jgi:tetratricopeptide (TPR) repeat protein